MTKLAEIYLRSKNIICDSWSENLFNLLDKVKKSEEFVKHWSNLAETYGEDLAALSLIAFQFKENKRGHVFSRIIVPIATASDLETLGAESTGQPMILCQLVGQSVEYGLVMDGNAVIYHGVSFSDIFLQYFKALHFLGICYPSKSNALFQLIEYCFKIKTEKPRGQIRTFLTTFAIELN